MNRAGSLVSLSTPISAMREMAVLQRRALGWSQRLGQAQGGGGGAGGGRKRAPMCRGSEVCEGSHLMPSRNRGRSLSTGRLRIGVVHLRPSRTGLVNLTRTKLKCPHSHIRKNSVFPACSSAAVRKGLLRAGGALCDGRQVKAEPGRDRALSTRWCKFP